MRRCASGRTSTRPASQRIRRCRDDASQSAANYDCHDGRTLTSLRTIQRGDHGFDWAGNVGVYLPPDAVGHDVAVLGSGTNGAVKMAVVVRDGVQFASLRMDGVEVRTGEPLAFEYGPQGPTPGPAILERPDPVRPFYGALRVKTPGVYRLNFAIDGIDQGSVVIALCRTELQSAQPIA